MQIYKQNATSITIAGQTFTADGDGIIDVPKHLVGNAFSQGFVSAKGRLAQLAEQRAIQSQSAEPTPEPLPIKPKPAKESTTNNPGATL